MALQQVFEQLPDLESPPPRTPSLLYSLDAGAWDDVFQATCTRPLPTPSPVTVSARVYKNRLSANKSRHRLNRRIQVLETALFGTRWNASTKTAMLNVMLKKVPLPPVDKVPGAPDGRRTKIFKTSESRRCANRESARKSRHKKRLWLSILESGPRNDVES